MSKRARRRSDRDRMKAKAERIYPGQCPGKLADNLHPCSCRMCDRHKRLKGERVLPPRERQFTDDAKCCKSVAAGTSDDLPDSP